MKKGVKDYTFDDLVPCSTLDCGIEVYDSTSFLDIYSVQNVSIPKKPVILKANDVIRKINGDGYVSIGSQNVLFSHGCSTTDSWFPTYDQSRSVEEILREIENEGVEIDLINICNSGGYVLPTKDGVQKYTYPKSKIEGLFCKKEGKVLGRIDSGDINLKGEVIRRRIKIS